jgi:adenylosuccinate synthase
VEAIEPVYDKLPGWCSPTRGLSHFEDLPRRALDYLQFLADQTGVEVGCISTGPERAETIFIPGSKLEKLLS